MSISIRAGRYMLKTECGKCGRSFGSPDKALAHSIKQHRIRASKPPTGKPIFKVEWTRKGTISDEIMLGMEMGETWDARTPENMA